VTDTARLLLTAALLSAATVSVFAWRITRIDREEPGRLIGELRLAQWGAILLAGMAAMPVGLVLGAPGTTTVWNDYSGALPFGDRYSMELTDAATEWQVRWQVTAPQDVPPPGPLDSLALLQTPPNGFAIRQQVVEVGLHGRALVRHATQRQRQRQGKGPGVSGGLPTGVVLELHGAARGQAPGADALGIRPDRELAGLCRSARHALPLGLGLARGGLLVHGQVQAHHLAQCGSR
jgi:hypothetical protein